MASYAFPAKNGDTSTYTKVKKTNLYVTGAAGELRKTHPPAPGVVDGHGDEGRLQVGGAVHHQPLQVERQVRERR